MKRNETVIPQIRMFFKDEDRTNSFVMLRQKKHLRKQTYTRYRMGSVVMFNCAESPMKTISEGDSVQTGSQGSYLRLFALSYGMTGRVRT